MLLNEELQELREATDYSRLSTIRDISQCKCLLHLISRVVFLGNIMLSKGSGSFKFTSYGNIPTKANAHGVVLFYSAVSSCSKAGGLYKTITVGF